MNCKPGDLARYVGRVAKNYGRLVKVVAATTIRSSGEPSWITAPCFFMPNGEEARSVADRLLRPIRDPGDDARDESLNWLPVPSEKEAA